MANVLTDLAADIYKAADIVGRELTGFIPACTINADGSERVALGDTVRSHFTREATAVDNTPSMTIPEGTDQTVDNKTMSITKSRGIQIPWTGEDIKSVNNGSGFETIQGDQIAQAMRTLTNEIEIDLGVEAYTNASRAVGTAGTTPFASDFDLVAEARQILVDNGAPINDGRTSLVLGTPAGTNLRNLAQLQKANEAGSDRMLRQGTLLDLQGMMLRESAGTASHTKGTATGLDANGAHAIKATTVALDGGDGGSLLTGDVVTFAGDANKYVVDTGFTAVSGNMVLNDPGLRAALAGAEEMTIGNNFAANVAFHQSALELVIRPPAMPNGGDAAVDAMLVQDPHSGLVFEIRVYKGFQKTMMNVSVAWGFKAWKDQHIALVMG